MGNKRLSDKDREIIRAMETRKKFIVLDTIVQIQEAIKTKSTEDFRVASHCMYMLLQLYPQLEESICSYVSGLYEYLVYKMN